MTTRTSLHAVADVEDGYDDFEKAVQSAVIKATSGPLFTTDADDLFETYLAAIPEERRQHYNCRTCKRFIESFGSLVSIAADGSSVSIWDAGVIGCVPSFFADIVVAMSLRVRRAKVTGVFVSELLVLGTPQTKEWTHLAGRNARPYVALALKTASQRAAELTEDYGMLCRGLAEYPEPVVAEGRRVLEADALSRSEKVVEMAKWLEALHGSIARSKGRKANLVWAAVATAPPGWAHVKTTMISTLLDDIVAGMDFAAVSRRWAEKMHPLQYQRPQAPPKAGNIAQAEKLVEAMGIRPSFERRFARLDEVTAIWRPSEAEAPAPAGGMFDHLKPKTTPVKLQLPSKTMTMEKFLPLLAGAKSIEFHVYASGNFCALVTAVNADSPPIIQWDGIDGLRNPVSWYVYHNGSLPHRWGLAMGWTKVTAVCASPAHWQRPDLFKHFGEARLFVLDGCHDAQHSGAALFPEILRTELREVRSVIEAYSGRANVDGVGSASGILFHKGSLMPLMFRVDGQEITIDRWE
jgi:hypothetical protein